VEWFDRHQDTCLKWNLFVTEKNPVPCGCVLGGFQCDVNNAALINDEFFVASRMKQIGLPFFVHLQLVTLRTTLGLTAGPQRIHNAFSSSDYTGCPRRNGQNFRSVPYVKIYRYNAKHLYPKLNDYGDMAIEKCGFWGVHVLYAVRDAIFVHCACPATRHRNAVTLVNALQHGSSDVTR